MVVAFGAGAAGLIGPEAAVLATGLAPLAEAGLGWFSTTIRTRRQEHAADTVMHGADEYGAETMEQFVAFMKALVSDEEHQELLARTLTLAQDTAMRDKRRALGRALASAASDTGTRVDEELLYIRVLDDLDEPHIRLLRLLSATPPHLTAIGLGDVRQWFPWSIAQADPGLAETVWALLGPLQRHGLIWMTTEQYHVPGGSMENQCEISPYGEWFLTRLAEPE
jgi:hypothetical protein